jgi:membrane protein DedA with SNARE-associated domain/rhodanese-related sulfurtransferase
MVVFAKQIGVPVPAFPILIAAGVLAGTGHLSVLAVTAAAVVAALAADWIWYELGRRRGRWMLDLLCRIALEPRSCITRTEDFFKKHGMRSLVAGKFVPGLGTVAPPLAGIAGLTLAGFLVYDGLGIFLWVGSTVGFGYVFNDRIDTAMEYAGTMTPAVLVIGAAALSFYIVGKALRRRMELRRVLRISADELWKKLEGWDVPLVVDVRARSVSARDGVIPGAIVMPADEMLRRYRELPPNRDVVVYCACLGDLASADVVRFLHGKGLVRARVLEGGIGAWRAARLAATPASGAGTLRNDEQVGTAAAAGDLANQPIGSDGDRMYAREHKEQEGDRHHLPSPLVQEAETISC